MRPTSNGQTARDVRASVKSRKQALAEKLEIAPEKLDALTAACVADTFVFLTKLGLRKPVESGGACTVCGTEPDHGTIMVGDTCSKCWRQG